MGMKSLKWEEIGTKNLFPHTSTWELLRWLALYNISPTRHDTRNYYQSGTAASYLLLCPRPRGGGHSGIARSNIRHIRLPVPWRSCLGYRHTGCLQLSHRWSPEMCGLRTRPRMDVDPPRFLPPSNCHRRGAYRFAASGAIPCSNTNLNSDSV